MNRRAFLLRSTAVATVAVLPPTTLPYRFVTVDTATPESIVFWGENTDGNPVFDVTDIGVPTRQSFRTVKGLARNVPADPRKAMLSVPRQYRQMILDDPWA